MKKVLYFLAAAGFIMTMLAFTNCNANNNTKQAGVKAREYARNVQNRNYNQLVNHMTFSDYVTVDDVDNYKAAYRRILNEKIDPIIRDKGGIRDIEIVSESASNDGQTATVVLRNIYNNGQTEEFTYDLVWINNQWMIDMDQNRQVWDLKTADGRDVSFTVKDYEDKKVFKQNVDGDRSFIKVLDDGEDGATIKTLKDGDRNQKQITNREQRRLERKMNNRNRR